MDCGEPTEVGSRCGDCQTVMVRRNRSRSYERERFMGYDRPAWRRLRAQAIRIQPWCTDCGSLEDLTGDHLPSAIEKLHAHLPLTLDDVEVTCRRCNDRRGPALGRMPMTGHEVQKRGVRPAD